MTESYRQALDTPVCEKTTTQISLPLTDENDQLLPPGVLTTVTLTLYDRDSGSIINSRNGVSINGANGGTVSTAGLLLVLTPADNAFIDATKSREVHIALIQWTWSAGAKSGAKELAFTVFNQAKIT